MKSFFFVFFFCFYQKRLIRMPKRRRKPVEIRLRDLKFENERVAMETVIGRCIFFFYKSLLFECKKTSKISERVAMETAHKTVFFYGKKRPSETQTIDVLFLID